MPREDEICSLLINEFPVLKDSIKVIRPRRIEASLESEWVNVTAKYMKDCIGARQICTITGLDGETYMDVIYHLATTDGILINLRTKTPRSDPHLDTITGVFPGAVLYERELADLLGITVSGLPEGERYPLPEDWPEGEYPLRKDWKPGQSETAPLKKVEFKPSGLQEASVINSDIANGGGGNRG
jgi:NADH:ubiquinone oxidoreductase subunit C